MPEDRPTRFKSRFSILSLLPARHPPLQPNPPPLPTKQSLPPTRSVRSRQPTIVSVNESSVSPVQSEYPLSAYTYSPPILPPSAPFTHTASRSSSPLSTARSPASTSRSFETKGSARSGRRPPPLDLRRTKQAYPGVTGVIPTAGTLAPQEIQKEEEEDAIFRPSERQTRREREQKRKAIEKREKEEKRAMDDPFAIAEVEPGHRYTSWRGGRVSIKPGQIIPEGAVEGTPTIRGIDPDDLAMSRNAVTLERLEQSKPTKSQHLETPNMYDSVLHDVLLTPTYLRHSPAIPPTPSPHSSRGEVWHDIKSRQRKTIVDALKRGSRMLRWNEHERSLRNLKDREAQEMSRFRQAVRPVRFVDEPVVGYSSSPRWKQLGSANVGRTRGALQPENGE